MDKSLVAAFFAIIFRYRVRLFIAVFLAILSNTLLILNPLVFRQAILTLLFLDPIPAILPAWMIPWFRSVYPWALILFSIALVSALLKYYMRLAFISISREVECDVRAKLFERIQNQSQAFFDRHPIGDLLSRLSNDITAYRDLLGPGLMYPVVFLSITIPALAALFYLSPFLAIVSMLPIIFIYVLNIVIRTPMYRLSHQVQQSLADMSAMTHEHYSGIRVIKAYGSEAVMANIFEKICQKSSILNRHLASFQGLIPPLLALVSKLVTLSLVLLAGVIILKGWGQMNMADFLSFIWIQSYLFFPLLMLGWVLPMYHKGKAAYARLFEIYQEPIEVYTRSS